MTVIYDCPTDGVTVRQSEITSTEGTLSRFEVDCSGNIDLQFEIPRVTVDNKVTTCVKLRDQGDKDSKPDPKGRADIQIFTHAEYGFCPAGIQGN